MNNLPVISVITTTFNSEKYLEETILSVITQKGNFNIEYILIDAASTDNTLKIINKYKALIDQNIFEISCNNVKFNITTEKDNGMYEGLAKGLKKISGDFVCYINADDFYLPNAFQTVIDIFDTFSDVNWLTGMPLTFNEKSQIVSENIKPPFCYYRKMIRRGLYLFYTHPIQQESTFWRAKIMRNFDFDNFSKFKYAGDFYIWHTFSQFHNLYFAYIFVAGFRIRPNQLSKIHKTDYKKEFYFISGRNNLFDYLFIFIYKIIYNFFPTEIKKLLSKTIIYYNNGWKKSFK